jgi:predicted Zn-dependent peptidase
MEKHKLRNGLNIFIERMPSKSVSIEICVKAGSVNESKKVSGISHFIEHMLFNGTKKRPSSHAISNEIEKLGGDFNAATSHERTVFYVKVPGKHIDVALDVLSDMFINPLFDEKTTEKEKKIIIDEIKMINDQPRYLQWVLFQEALFKKHPAKNPIYGSIEVVNSLHRDDLINYFRSYYQPKNMSIFVVGNTGKNILSKVERYFGSLSQLGNFKKKRFFEPKQTSLTIKRLKRKTLQSYMILGYKTPNRRNKDCFSLDIIRAILGKGQSGWIFDRVRTELGLAYDVGVVHHPCSDFGFFSVYVNTAKKNQELVKKEILLLLKKLEAVSEKEIIEAKTFIEGEYLLTSEDSQKRADMLSYWDSVGVPDGAITYLKNIKKVTKKDIIAISKKYFTKNYALAIIE